MGRPDGISCPHCGLVRAPAIPTCPSCRSPEADDASGPPGLDEGDASVGNLPSRVVLATIPLSWMVLAMLVTASERWGSRPLGYVTDGGTSAAVAIGAALAVCVPVAWLAVRLAPRVRLAGQRASSMVVVLAVVAGLGPLVFRSVSRAVESANTDGIELGPPELAECVWTEARHFRSSSTGGLSRIAVSVSCVLPDGEPLDLDIDIEAASDVDGAHVTVPTWRGRYYGRLIAPSAASVSPPPAP